MVKIKEGSCTVVDLNRINEQLNKCQTEKDYDLTFTNPEFYHSPCIIGKLFINNSINALVVVKRFVLDLVTELLLFLMTMV